MSKRILNFWPLIFLISITFLLRIISLEKLFYFTYDESIPAFVGRRLILWQHIPLIGGATPFGFHLGPYFYWFLSITLIIGKLNPVIWGYTGALIASGTTFLMYVVGNRFGGRRVGLTASIFWAFSFLANIYDRHLWALYWGPILSLIVIFSIYKIIKKNENYIFVLAIALAFGIHTDPSNLVFVPFALVIWIIYKLALTKKTVFAIFIVIFSFLPLLVFDLKHNYANTRPFLDFIRKGENTPGFETNTFITNSLIFPRAFTRLFYLYGDNEIAKQYSYCSTFVSEKFNSIPKTVLAVSSTALLCLVFWALRNKKKHPQWFLVALLLTLYFVGIQIYGTLFKADIFEHYLTGLFAMFLLIAAKIVSYLPKRIWFLIIAVFVTFNMIKLLQAKNSLGLLYKKQAIEFTMESIGERPFSLDSLSTCWKYSGYRYLFSVFGKEPTKSYVDPNFAYLYGTTPVAEKHPETVVSFVVRDFVQETEEFYKRYAQLKDHEVESGTFGNIEVIIMDNSSGWFD